MLLIRNPKGIEIDLPVLNKFLLCLPLRPGLLMWGIMQFIFNVFLQVFSVYEFYQFIRYIPHVPTSELFEKVLVFTLFLIVTFIDCAFCSILVLGTKTKNCNFLEVAYYYQRMKVVTFSIVQVFIFFVKFFVYNSLFRNLDSVRHFFLVEEQAMGLIDLIGQFYLMLLIRSYIIKLDHKMDLSTLKHRLFQCRQGSVDSHSELAKTPLPLWEETKTQENIVDIQNRNHAPASLLEF